MEIKQIQQFEYAVLLDAAKKLNPKTALNIEPLEDSEGVIFLASTEGISYVKANGMLGGLARFKEGKEQISKIHQEFRINLGGTFLECFDTKLVSLYKRQGFKVVARIPFNPEFAPKGWKKDKDLIKQPDIVFLSIVDKEEKTFISYESALKYSETSTTFMCRKHSKGIDRSNVDYKNISDALKSMRKEIKDISQFVKWSRFIDIYFKRIKGKEVSNKNYIRIIK